MRKQEQPWGQELHGAAESLSAAEKRLRRLCHDRFCRGIYTCPLDHEKCAKKLDLGTAIAWHAADMLKRSRSYISDITRYEEGRERYSALRVALDSVHFMANDIDLLHRVVSLHGYENADLFSALTYAVTVMYDTTALLGVVYHSPR